MHDVPRSKAQNVLSGPSGGNGDYVCVDSGAFKIVSAEVANQRSASAHPSNPPGGASQENTGGLRTFVDLEPEGPATIQGTSASKVEVISVLSSNPSPTRVILILNRCPFVLKQSLIGVIRRSSYLRVLFILLYPLHRSLKLRYILGVRGSGGCGLARVQSILPKMVLISPLPF